MAKYVRVFSPNKFTRTLLNLKFYSSFSIYYFVIKIYNNILIIKNIIDRITYRSISYIIICSFILWFFIFLFIFYKLYYMIINEKDIIIQKKENIMKYLNKKMNK